VACVKRLSRQDIESYGHLNLKIVDGELVIPAPAPPPATSGKYSSTNVNGDEVVRRDLPMYTKSYVMQAPDWNGYGTHDVWIDREVYHRDFIPPKEVSLSIELLGQEPDGSQFTVKFGIDEVLNRTDADFETELLFNLNILQENVGAVSLFASTATLAQYLETIRVDWEILPPGNVDEVIRRMLQGKRPVSPEKQVVMRERLTVLERMRPQHYIAGTNEFLRYFGAKFEEDFIVFENLNYGNALYIMHEDWETLSRKSRTDLLKGPRDGFERIPHTEGWGANLSAYLRKHRRRAQQG